MLTFVCFFFFFVVVVYIDWFALFSSKMTKATGNDKRHAERASFGNACIYAFKIERNIAFNLI